MSKLYTIINGIKIFRIQLIDLHTYYNSHNRICAICGKEIKDREEISLLSNNNKLFPNIWVHDSHITEKYDPELTIKYLIWKYNRYLSHANERKIWEYNDSTII